MVPTIATWELRGQATLQHYNRGRRNTVELHYSTHFRTRPYYAEKSPLLGGNLHCKVRLEHIRIQKPHFSYIVKEYVI